MFRFTQEPSSGSYDQCLVKIKSLVQLCMSVQTLSVLWGHIPITLTTSAPTRTAEQDL